MKTKPIADRFHVRPAWTRRVQLRRREMGETTPRPMGEATVVKIDAIRLAEFGRQPPDATREEQRGRPRELIEATGVRLVFLPPYGRT